MCCACHRADVQMSPLVLEYAHFLWQQDPGSLQSGRLAATAQTLRLQHAAIYAGRQARHSCCGTAPSLMWCRLSHLSPRVQLRWGSVRCDACCHPCLSSQGHAVMADLHSVVCGAFQWCNAHQASFSASLVF
jgi:hypothetical protein